MTSYTNEDRHRKRNRARARAVGARGVFDAQDVEARIDKQEALCHYCGAELAFSGREKFTVDHFIPLSQGGSNWASNIVIACRKCNRAKGTRLPWDFMPERFRKGAGRDG